jgi:hypothetical protein
VSPLTVDRSWEAPGTGRDARAARKTSRRGGMRIGEGLLSQTCRFFDLDYRNRNHTALFHLVIQVIKFKELEPG